MNKLIQLALGLLVFAGLSAVSVAETTYKPFVLASTGSGAMADTVAAVKGKLTAAGFQVVGEVEPYPTAHIIVVTNDELKNTAAQTPFGGFGAVQRITVTSADGQVQVAYTNPLYTANIYRLKGDLAGVRKALAAALGDQGEYGPDEGLTAEDLRDYHYKWLMPYFTDRLELAEYPGFDAAVRAVEANLAKGAGGVRKVYRVDIPGKQQAVIGVSMAGPDSDTECSGDAYIMERIDFKKVKSSGHLPYEILIDKGKVYALPAEFRIAISFPDLSMMGSNSFASIMCAPSAIEEALTAAAGGQGEED